MLEGDRVSAIFADAWTLYDDAIEILELGKQRIAAEAAWGATKRATDALILARTGREPSGTGQTSGGMRGLARREPVFEPISQRFRARIRILHAECFYDGNGISPRVVETLIRGTGDYMRQLESYS